MRIEVLDDAKRDLVDGFRFYEERPPGLGSYFLGSLFAGTHRVVYGSRRYIASRFPFAIYHRVENEVVRVRAVVDYRRSPAWIHRRLRRPSA